MAIFVKDSIVLDELLSKVKWASVLFDRNGTMREEEFINSFYGKNDKPSFDFSDYRIHIVKSDNVSFDDFIKAYSKDKVEALRMTFLQDFKPYHAELIDMAILKGKIDLRDLYDKHISNPEKNIMKYVL